MHLFCPPKFSITFVFHLSWVLQPSQEKLKTMLKCKIGAGGGGGEGGTTGHPTPSPTSLSGSSSTQPQKGSLGTRFPRAWRSSAIHAFLVSSQYTFHLLKNVICVDTSSPPPSLIATDSTS